MECVEGALKSCSRKDFSVRNAQPPAILDDFCVVNGQIAVSGDEFLVDELLDLSNGFVEEEEGVEKELQGKQNNIGCSSASTKQGLNEGNNSNHGTIFTVSAVDDFRSLPGSELSVPEEDMANLEWLSHFVEDSFSGYPPTDPAGKLAERQMEKLSQPAVTVQTKHYFTTSVQTKTRSKRTRTGGRIRSLGSPSLTEYTTTSCSSSSSSTTSSPYSSPWLIYANPCQTESVLGKPPAKKPKKKPYAVSSEGVRVAAPQPRRCSHCGVQKTPQWRAGPNGAKTLCNACGVRYKSGRLLPEYRPACSPTFKSELHSNNHRKVLEMRRKKEF